LSNAHSTIWVQTACHVNASCLEMGLKIMGFITSLTSYCSIANISSGIHIHHKDPVT